MAEKDKKDTATPPEVREASLPHGAGDPYSRPETAAIHESKRPDRQYPGEHMAMSKVQDADKLREAYLARCRMVAEGVKALTEAGMGETTARELALKIFEKMND